jgi:hypothetical protein
VGNVHPAIVTAGRARPGDSAGIVHDPDAMPPRAAAVALFALAVPGHGADAPQYALRYDEAARAMQVDLCLATAAPRARFASDGHSLRQLDGFERSSGADLAREGRTWIARDWKAGECLRYRADLGRIADAQPRRGIDARGGAVLTDPASWLLEVDGASAGVVRLHLPAGVAISAPWQPLPADGEVPRYRVSRTPDNWMGRVALGRFVQQSIRMPGGTLHVAILGETDATQRERLLGWLGRVSLAATSAHGRLPLADVQVLVASVGRQREAVVFGQSLRGQGNGLTLFVDPSQSREAFARDWVAVHEMSHLFHPHLGDAGAWLAEGLATWYQNALRARAGLLTPEEAWRELDAGFARGQAGTPARSVLTLEQASTRMGENHDYMRVYWSGAAYWLAAELELRRRGLPGVDPLLQRFDACCLPAAQPWQPRDFVARLDQLGGGGVLGRLFEAWHARRDFPAIEPLYRELGLRRGGNGLHFADDAPQAALRIESMQAAAPPSGRRPLSPAR